MDSFILVQKIKLWKLENRTRSIQSEELINWIIKVRESDS